jgi:hypothetical protein
VSVPGPGLRLRRAVLASGGGPTWSPGRLQPVAGGADGRGHLSRLKGRSKCERPGIRLKCLVAAVRWVEPPVGIEPMTYALRGGAASSSAVRSSQSFRVLQTLASTGVHDCPGVLLANSLARLHRRRVPLSPWPTTEDCETSVLGSHGVNTRKVMIFTNPTISTNQPPEMGCSLHDAVLF